MWLELKLKMLYFLIIEGTDSEKSTLRISTMNAYYEDRFYLP